MQQTCLRSEGGAQGESRENDQWWAVLNYGVSFSLLDHIENADEKNAPNDEVDCSSSAPAIFPRSEQARG
jgi:hypothetical protein